MQTVAQLGFGKPAVHTDAGIVERFNPRHFNVAMFLHVKKFVDPESG